MSDQEADHDDICQTIRQRALRLGHGMHTCDCPRRRAEAAPPPLDGLREAMAEMVDAYSARPDTDEMDHPEGLTGAQVEQAWDVWSLRQDRALETARIVLVALRDEGETT